MDISRIDLNLLPILTALMKHQNTLVVAQQLNKSQPAISRGLSKLREQLGDELFTRTAHGLEPTAYAHQLAKKLPTALHGLSSALEMSTFDPGRLNEKISIVSISTVIEPYGANILRAIHHRAPACEVEIIAWCSHVEQKLLDGMHTIGINNLINQRTQKLTQRTIKKMDLVMVCREDHPYRKGTADASFFKYPTIVLRVPGWNETKVRYFEALKKNNIDYQMAFATDNINLALEMIRTSDFTMGISRSLAERMDGVKILSLIEPLQVRGQIAVTMRTSHRNDPKYQWLTELIRNAINQ